jgi:hypothetical protein
MIKIFNSSLNTDSQASRLARRLGLNLADAIPQAYYSPFAGDAPYERMRNNKLH